MRPRLRWGKPFGRAALQLWECRAGSWGEVTAGCPHFCRDGASSAGAGDDSASPGATHFCSEGDFGGWDPSSIPPVPLGTEQCQPSALSLPAAWPWQLHPLVTLATRSDQAAPSS